MKNREVTDAKNDWQLTIYIPQSLRNQDPIERLKQEAQRQRRSMNFLAVDALLDYLDQIETQR